MKQSSQNSTVHVVQHHNYPTHCMTLAIPAIYTMCTVYFVLACPAELQEEVHCDWSIDMTNKGVFSNAAQSHEWSGHTNTPTAEVILLHIEH